METTGIYETRIYDPEITRQMLLALGVEWLRFTTYWHEDETNIDSNILLYNKSMSLLVDDVRVPEGHWPYAIITHNRNIVDDDGRYQQTKEDRVFSAGDHFWAAIEDFAWEINDNWIGGAEGTVEYHVPTSKARIISRVYMADPSLEEEYLPEGEVQTKKIVFSDNDNDDDSDGVNENDAAWLPLPNSNSETDYVIEPAKEPFSSALSSIVSIVANARQYLSVTEKLEELQREISDYLFINQVKRFAQIYWDINRVAKVKLLQQEEYNDEGSYYWDLSDAVAFDAQGNELPLTYPGLASIVQELKVEWDSVPQSEKSNETWGGYSQDFQTFLNSELYDQFHDDLSISINVPPEYQLFECEVDLITPTKLTLLSILNGDIEQNNSGNNIATINNADSIE